MQIRGIAQAITRLQFFENLAPSGYLSRAGQKKKKHPPPKINLLLADLEPSSAKKSTRAAARSLELKILQGAPRCFFVCVFYCFHRVLLRSRPQKRLEPELPRLTVGPGGADRPEIGASRAAASRLLAAWRQLGRQPGASWGVTARGRRRAVAATVACVGARALP